MAGFGEARAYFEQAALIDTDECQEWPFGGSGWYGKLGGERVHVLACERQHGPKPFPEAQAAHFCENHACFNRRHLRWATGEQNRADVSGVNSGVAPRFYTTDPQPGCFTLEAEDVLSIRTRVANNEYRSQQDLADEYGINRASVTWAINPNNWVGIPTVAELTHRSAGLTG